MSLNPSVGPVSPSGEPGGADHLAVVEASPNAIVAIEIDGLIAYANPRVEATFGRTPKELIGQPVELLIPGRVHERHVGHPPPSTRPRARET
jgi:PAS domain-containing protein